MVGQKVGKLVARVAQIQIVEGEGSMKRSLNSITANSSRNEEQKIIDTENHESLEIYFLRQYVIVYLLRKTGTINVVYSRRLMELRQKKKRKCGPTWIMGCM